MSKSAEGDSPGLGRGYTFKSLAGLVILFLVHAMHLGSGIAYAGEGDRSGLYLGVVIPIEIQNDGNFKSDLRGNKRNDLFTTVEPEITLVLLPGLSLFAHAVLEPMRDARQGEDRFFRSHGILLEDLYLQYKGTLKKEGPNVLGFRVWGGKFTPNFGFAWDAAPGIYGTDFAEDYELAERIGFGGAMTLQHGALGTHTLSASTFILDRIVSGSLITRRARTRLSDGGPGNTPGLRSFHIALEGEKIPGLEGITYHASVVHQGIRGGSNEAGISAGLTLAFEVRKFTISPLIEFVHFRIADAMGRQSRNYLTTGVKVERDGWHGVVSQTFRHTRAPGAGTVRDNLVQLSGGYTFKTGLGIEIGWSHRKEHNIGTHTFGVLLTYELSFEAGAR